MTLSRTDEYGSVWIAVTGNITDGHTHFGPFASLDLAREFGGQFAGRTYMFYMHLEPPTDSAASDEFDRLNGLANS